MILESWVKVNRGDLGRLEAVFGPICFVHIRLGVEAVFPYYRGKQFIKFDRSRTKTPWPLSTSSTIRSKHPAVITWTMRSALLWLGRHRDFKRPLVLIVLSDLRFGKMQLPAPKPMTQRSFDQFFVTPFINLTATLLVFRKQLVVNPLTLFLVRLSRVGSSGSRATPMLRCTSADAACLLSGSQ